MGTLDVNGRMQIKINIRVKREIRKLMLEKAREITSKTRSMTIIVCRLYVIYLKMKVENIRCIMKENRVDI